MPAAITVVFPIFPGVTQLDFTGPYQVLVRTPGVEAVVASLGGKAVNGSGLTFANLAVLEDIDRCDVICVPGGNVVEAMSDAAFVSHVRRLALSARYVTSVCTGSLILGAAGLVEGRRVASHWAFRELLSAFGGIPDPGRVVRDGHLITGGGVTAGIDFALTLAAELTDDATAQSIQLALEYAPSPPFDAGRPETAPPDVASLVRERYAPMLASHRAILERIATAGAK